MAGLFSGQGLGADPMQQRRVLAPVDALAVLNWILSGAQATLSIVFTAGVRIAGAQVLVPDKEELTETFS